MHDIAHTQREPRLIIRKFSSFEKLILMPTRSMHARLSTQSVISKVRCLGERKIGGGCC